MALREWFRRGQDNLRAKQQTSRQLAGTEIRQEAWVSALGSGRLPPPASFAHNPAGSNTPASSGWSCAPAQTAAPPPADSSRPLEWLALHAHTRPPYTTSEVCHKSQPVCIVLGRTPRGGLLFVRHKPTLTRRFVVYYCSAVYTGSLF